MKNKKINIIILVLALSIVLYFSLEKDLYGVIKNISKIRPQYFLLAIVLFLLSLLFKSLSLKANLNKYYEDYSLKKAYNLILIGQFMNGITPFQSGGQPFQIYMLKKEGKRISDSTSAMLKDSLAYQISLVLIGFVSLIINYTLKIFNNKSLSTLVIIGFSVNMLVLLFLIFIIIGRKKSIRFTNNVLEFLCRFKIFKRLDNKKDELKRSINRFYSSLSDVRNNKLLLLKTVIYNIINMLLLYSVVYIIFLSLGNSNISLPLSILSISFVMLIGNFIPIPGATGGIEYGFCLFFGYFISGSILTSAMLLWRFVTYILGMFIGFVTFIIWKGRRK